jgi:hypothetical protein
VCWWLGKVVPIPLECLEDEVGHRGGDLAHGGGIIPVEGDAEEAGTSPVDMRFVLGFEYTEKVFDIGGVGILDPEVESKLGEPRRTQESSDECADRSLLHRWS